MDPTTKLRDTVLGRWHISGRDQLRTIQHYFDRRNLEASLASLLDAANGHAARGLKPGSAFYLVLHRESQLRVAAYCDRWQIDPARLHAELPALSKLAQLSQPPSPKAALFKVVLIVLAAIATAVLIGLAGAFIRLGYVLGGGR
jgi:hypothetical protein